MKKVITYGTFDMFHYGHLNLLKRAKALGDYLIVGVTSENYDISRGKLNVKQNLMQRIENVKATGLADEIIIEEYFGQKIHDIKKYDIDIFAIGSDWEKQFDYLKSFCDVIYLPRTQGVSSTEIRNSENSVLEIGIIGNGRIAKRFIKEAKYVSGINIDNVFGRNPDNLKIFCDDFNLKNYYTEYDKFLDNVKAVYIAVPHTMHYEYAKRALEKGKHVLCEKPITLSGNQTKELYKIAQQNGVVLYEAIKTVYAPCFSKLVSIAQSGIIGKIRDVDATFTKIIKDKTLREYNPQLGGGSLTELGSYPLSIITKLLGKNPIKTEYISTIDTDTGVDTMTKVILIYKDAVATANTGIATKKEGECIISGTEGYIYIPAPWWKTEYFEIRFEDLNKTQKIFEKFNGDGLRYEISEFLYSINSGKTNYKWTEEDSVFVSEVLENGIAAIKSHNSSTTCYKLV